MRADSKAMLSILTWDSLSLWPAVAAVGLALTAAVVWLYPPQLRSAGWSGWVPLLLRWCAVMTIAGSLLKPVLVEPKSAEELGSVLVLLDCSRSMGVIDVGRTPAEWVALADGLGMLPPGSRSAVPAALVARVKRIDLLRQEVVRAQSDLDYARVSGRGVAEKQRQLDEAVARYTSAATETVAAADPLPQGIELRQKLKDLEGIPDREAREPWSGELRQRIKAAAEAAEKYQLASDLGLYKSNQSVHTVCDEVAKLSRLALAERAVLRSGTGLVARLEGQAPISMFAIDNGLLPITFSSRGRMLSTLPIKADGNESDLTGAVTNAVASLIGRPIRAVVLFSDGRQVGGRNDIVSGLAPSGVPVFTVGVAPREVLDLSVTGVQLRPETAFVGESVQAVVDVRREGSAPVPAQLHVTAGGIDHAERLEPQGENRLQSRFALRIEGPDAASGAQRIIFTVPPAPGEVSAVNNQVERWIKVVNGKLPVAAFTAAPSWDFQYVRTNLSRSPWVRLTAGVLDGEHPNLPLTPQQILEQDVLLLSDVPVAALDVAQWDAVRELVNDRGGSFILVPGPSYPLADYAQQPLAQDLLPFRDPSKLVWREWPGEQPMFHFLPTPQGDHEALRLGDGSDSSLRRWQELPGVYRYLHVPDDLKADARKLLVESATGSPVLIERRVGSGRVLVLGLTETWRWRQKVGERDQDRFWRQLVRYAAGEPYAATSGPLALDADKVAAAPGESIQVRASVRGAKSPAPRAAYVPLEVLHHGKPFTVRRLMPVGGMGSGRYAGDLRDLPPGEYVLQVRGVAADNAAVRVQVPLQIVVNTESEMRDLSGDPGFLRKKLSQPSGGEYLALEQVRELPERINAIRNTSQQFSRKPLWNSPLLYTFVLACLGAEWALRKRLGLA